MASVGESDVERVEGEELMEEVVRYMFAGEVSTGMAIVLAVLSAGLIHTFLEDSTKVDERTVRIFSIVALGVTMAGGVIGALAAIIG